MLDIPVPEIGLQCSRVVAFIRQGEAAGMAQHVWVNLQADASGLASAFEKPRKPGGGEGRSSLGREHERRPRLLLTL